MRTIKFRGKRKSDGVWIYGWLCEESYIANTEYPWLPQEEIMPETVGQFTGLKDKDGREIYEGDILELTVVNPHFGTKKPPRIRKVIWQDTGFAIVNKDNHCVMECVTTSEHPEYIVVGNIHDNPELINKEG